MKNFKKFMCCVLSLFILTLALGGCQDSKKQASAPESSSVESGASSKQESSEAERLPSNVALKYKSSEMDLKEYIAILFELSSAESFQGDMDKSKAKAIETGKLILLVGEKLKQSGKDLPQERKKSARDSLYQNLYNGAAGGMYGNGRSLSQAEKEEVLNICKKMLEAAGSSMEAYEQFAEDAERQKFGILEEHIEVKQTEYDDVIVNYDSINKVDIFSISKLISNIPN